MNVKTACSGARPETEYDMPNTSEYCISWTVVRLGKKKADVSVGMGWTLHLPEQNINLMKLKNCFWKVYSSSLYPATTNAVREFLEIA